MKLHFGYLLGLASLAIAGCAAFFSVYGISQLFAGASMAVIVMASALEFGKLVAASYLQRYWKSIARGMRIYVATGVIVLVIVTSAGIYGFLSNAYQKTANTYEIHQSEMAILQSKHDAFERKIVSNNTIIDNKNNRSVQLADLRANQEVRLDSLLANNHWVNARKTREDINLASGEIQKLTLDVDELNDSNGVLNDSINKYKILMVERESSTEVTAEIGPLKYLSTLTGLSMDRVVNYFILLLIFVFDPLAVALILATNWVFMDEKRKFDAMNPPPPPKPEPKIEPKIEHKIETITDAEKHINESMGVPKEMLGPEEPTKGAEKAIANMDYAIEEIDDASYEVGEMIDLAEKFIEKENKDEVKVQARKSVIIPKPPVVEPVKPVAKHGIVKPATGRTMQAPPPPIKEEEVKDDNINRNFSKPIPIRRDRKGNL